jgi:hypothetical protein
MGNANLTRELSEIKTKISKAVAIASELQIKTADDLTKATEILGKIKTAYKVVKVRKVALAGVAIAGVKVVERQTVAGITR